MQIGAISPNSLLASLYGSRPEALKAPVQPVNDIASQVQRARAEAGPNANVSVSYNYSVGPDGQLQISSASVTTTRRGEGIQRGVGGSIIENARPQSFADFAPARPNLSSAAFAELFGEPQATATPNDEFRDEAFGSVDNLNRARFGLNDFGIRAQEQQHFRAGAGVTSGTPQYDLVEGPDGQFYAVAGSVNISTGATADPEKASRDAAAVARAALAATDVSAQDISVARDAQSRAAGLYAEAQRLRAPERGPELDNLVA